MVKASADDALIAVEEQIKDVQNGNWSSSRATTTRRRRSRGGTGSSRRPRGAASASRSGSPNLTCPGPRRAAIITLLASLDFYIFAQAYAAADGSIRDWHDPRWWLGGLLGLCVFVVGVVFSHALKNLIAARAQRELLKRGGRGPAHDRPGGAREAGDDQVAAAVAAQRRGIFAVLLWAGFLLRLQGSATSSLVITLFQSLIPLVGVAAELFLFDPFHRVLPGFGRRHRRAEQEARPPRAPARGHPAQDGAPHRRHRAALRRRARRPRRRAAGHGPEAGRPACPRRTRDQEGP